MSILELVCALVFLAGIGFAVGYLVGWMKGADEAERVYQVGRYDKLKEEKP